jgi:hypothetical protein
MDSELIFDGMTRNEIKIKILEFKVHKKSIEDLLINLFNRICDIEEMIKYVVCKEKLEDEKRGIVKLGKLYQTDLYQVKLDLWIYENLLK